MTDAGMPAARNWSQRLEPARGRCRARLHDARKLCIERRHRQRDLHQIALRHAGEDVEIARDQRRLGDDAHGMAVALEHFEDATHDLALALDRLIGIGVGADGDGPRHIAGGGELAFQQLRRVGLCEQPGLEIDARREPEIGVGRPGKAIDAAVLAPPIGIDGAIERDVRRIIAGDDLAGAVDGHRCLERRQLLEVLPAVVEGDACERLVTAGGIRLRAAPAPALARDRHLAVGRRVEVDGSRSRPSLMPQGRQAAPRRSGGFGRIGVTSRSGASHWNWSRLPLNKTGT